VSFEKEGYIMFAIAPKCYILKSSKNDEYDEYGTFSKNIINSVYGKDGMNKSKYRKLVIMNQKKAFFSQCLPEFKGSRAIRNNRYIVEKNYKTHSVNTAIQEAIFTSDNRNSDISSLFMTSSTDVLAYLRFTL
jgi:hypothetical protein